MVAEFVFDEEFILCIYLPHAVPPVRWLALALSVSLLPVFVYLQRTRPKIFLITLSLAYIVNTSLNSKSKIAQNSTER